MDNLFQFIQPGEIADWPGKYPTLFVDQAELEDTVFSAVNLAQSADAFFSGIYPVQSPQFWWGDGVELPWYKDYWIPAGADNGLSPRPIRKEVEEIASLLRASVDHSSSGDPWSQASFLTEAFMNSDKLMMQGLAVEAMLAVDRFLSCISKKEFIDAMRWLTVAHVSIIECVVQAQKILGSISQNARVAANARHVEHRAMKADVFAWLQKNETVELKMDRAADRLMAAKIVPVTWRTIREWIGEWKKLQSASTP